MSHDLEIHCSSEPTDVLRVFFHNDGDATVWITPDGVLERSVVVSRNDAIRLARALLDNADVPASPTSTPYFWLGAAA